MKRKALIVFFATLSASLLGGPSVAVAGENLIHQSGNREISEINLKSHETAWRATLPGKVVSNPVVYRDSVYARIDTGRLLEISTATGKLLHSIKLE